MGMNVFWGESTWLVKKIYEREFCEICVLYVYEIYATYSLTLEKKIFKFRLLIFD